MAADPSAPEAPAKPRGRKRKALLITLILAAVVAAVVAFDIWRAHDAMSRDTRQFVTHISVPPLEPLDEPIGIAPCDAYVKALCGPCGGDGGVVQVDGGETTTADAGAALFGQSPEVARLRCSSARLAAADWRRVREGRGGSITIDGMPELCQRLVDALPRTHPRCRVEPPTAVPR